MLFSLALIFIIGITLGWIFERCHLPRLIGMLITGIVLGPYVLNLIDGSLLSISADLRQIALIVILIKAGLNLNIDDLKKVGRPAILMSFLPAVFEIAAVTFLAPVLFGISYKQAAIMGAVLGAVSPAVVVPKMVSLMEENYGTDKKIPQLILAGSSLDDVFVIVLFSTFISLEQGNAVSVMGFVQIPLSIILGVAAGIVCGLVLSLVFKRFHMRDSVKVLIIIAVSFLLTVLETALKDIVSVSGLLAVMSMALLLKIKLPIASERLSQKFGKLWVAAEIVLFVLVGAAVDITYIKGAGLKVVSLLLFCLALRSIGVLLCTIGTPLNAKERIFCVISYLPKATVQAAIGGVPLALGLSCGTIVLTVAVLSIIITAPLGAIGMELTYKKLLKRNTENDN